MNAIVAQIPLVLGVLAGILVGPAIAACFLWWRRSHRDARRRSPIGIDLLRSPGHTVREQLEEATNDLIWDVVLLCLMPLASLCLYLAEERIEHPAGPQVEIVFLVATLGFIAWMVRKLLVAGTRIDALHAGFDAELAVGQELDQLMRTGAAVFHDFPADGFNIDHVVVSAQGVFAVETKGYTKSARGKGRASATVTFDGHVLQFPTWTTSEPIEQAERQARWLSKWATSAVGGMVLVTPVLALPGWFVNLEGRSTVRVYSGRALGSLLNTPSKQPLSEVDLQRVAHQVEQRCRTVVPTYRRAGNAGK